MTLNLETYRGRLTVTDGAWGTELQKLGLAPGACPELWNAENPQAVERLARSYVQAGSEIILTNTFGANPFVLSRHGLAERVGELAERGAALSRRAAGEAAKVFASLGPTGQIVMMGEASEESIYAGFAEAARGFERGGADAVVIETMTELAEVSLAARAVRENTGLPVVASLTFGSGEDKCRTMMGATPEQAVEELASVGVGAFGANCGLGPDTVVRVVERYRRAVDAPVWVKPNAGLPVVVDGRTVFPLSPAEFAAYVPLLAKAGAAFIGGCCGTTPAHIKAVREAVDALR